METRITMDRIRDLDKVRDREVNKCLQLGEHYGSPLPFFLHEKFVDATDLRAMAKKWGVSPEDLRIYIAVQRYVNAVAQKDLQDLPLPEDVAGQLDVPAVQFQSYLQEQVKLIQDACSPDDEDDITLPWRDAMAEDWDDFEQDLLEEAARRYERQ